MCHDHTIFAQWGRQAGGEGGPNDAPVPTMVRQAAAYCSSVVVLCQHSGVQQSDGGVWPRWGLQDGQAVEHTAAEERPRLPLGLHGAGRAAAGGASRHRPGQSNNCCTGSLQSKRNIQTVCNNCLFNWKHIKTKLKIQFKNWLKE